MGGKLFIESVTLQNFRCFGEEPTRISLAPDLTAFIGSNGTGKTAVCQALQRVFGVSGDERTIRLDDFHNSDLTSKGVAVRELRIDLVLAFPELDGDESELEAVPDFYRHMSATPDGTLKARIVLHSVWTDDGTIDGNIDTRVSAVTTLEETYAVDQTHALPSAERARVQFIYVPAARDGARQVTSFLRGRLWRAAKWSDSIRDKIGDNSKDISAAFKLEDPTSVVEKAFGSRWEQLHSAGTHATAHFQPVEQDTAEVLREAELAFEPDPAGASRPARLLSDGQRSLLHLALTSATLDIERMLSGPKPPAGFDLERTLLPALTIVAVEEPENNLAPFYLSRIVKQFLELGAHDRTQVLLSSHSASAMSRVDPASVRFFRKNEDDVTSHVRRLDLPAEADEAAKYVRQAVQAHPELYFAKFVILGEGDSEQIVIPALAAAMGVDLDPAFVAMVPLGGRHTNHFWRLLDGLAIPHATLLDLDYGRSGGGPGRIRTACKNLADLGQDILEGLAPFDSLDAIKDDTPLKALKPVVQALNDKNVFFSIYLDLDMTMLEHYKAAYTALGAGQHGPDETSDASDAVLHKGGPQAAREYWTSDTNPKVRAKRQDLLRWYRYLFSNRSKPATHLSAIGRLTKDELANPPKQLARLIAAVRSNVGPV